MEISCDYFSFIRSQGQISDPANRIVPASPVLFPTLHCTALLTLLLSLCSAWSHSRGDAVRCVREVPPPGIPPQVP